MKFYATVLLLLCLFCSNCIADDNSKRAAIEEMFALTGVTRVADNTKKRMAKGYVDAINEAKLKKKMNTEANLIIEKHNKKMTDLINNSITWATIEPKLLAQYIRYSETNIVKMNDFFKTDLGQRVLAEHEDMDSSNKRNKHPASEELFKTKDGKDILFFLAELFRGANKTATEEFIPKLEELGKLMAGAKTDLDKIPNK